ncbi:MAG: helix-turn-helix transcriptional regulator [Clostridia bacterium]|nr:helix-turn-helix transcriptional regulator [Clostridia bacterium]
MSEIAKYIGQRIRNHRTRLGLSQEKLAELSGVHHTYIGQLERGEKNATLESIEKISKALNVSLSKLFEKLDESEEGQKNIPLQCYDLFSAKTIKEQEQLFNILLEIEKYNHK